MVQASEEPHVLQNVQTTKMSPEMKHSLELNGNAKHQESEEKKPELVQPQWEKELTSIDGVEYAPNLYAWLVDHSSKGDMFKWDHVTLRQALVQRGMMEDARFYMQPSKQALYAVWTLGKEMVGHPQIVHGGAIAFAFDESFGVLYASLNMGPGFTAHLGVDYRKPFPAGRPGCMEIRVEKIEGRKVFLKGKIRDGPEGAVYAESDALYIVPKKEAPKSESASS